MSITEAALLREVARVQRDKTLLDVRDLIDRIAVKKPGSRSWEQDDRTAKEFRADLVREIQRLKESE